MVLLASGKIFYEGMQSALRNATIDEDDVVHFIEICYCLEGGLYPMAMEIPVLNEYFENVSEVKDARFRNQCTMECEFCDCTRNIKLPGKPLMDELGSLMTSQPYHDIPTTNFIDIGRIKLNRKKQKEGVYALKSLCNDKSYNKLKPIFTGARHFWSLCKRSFEFNSNPFVLVVCIPCHTGFYNVDMYHIAVLS